LAIELRLSPDSQGALLSASFAAHVAHGPTLPGNTTDYSTLSAGGGAPLHLSDLPGRSTLNPQLSTLKPLPSTLNPLPSTHYPQPSTHYPQPTTLNPQASTHNPQPATLNPLPSTLNPQPSTPGRPLGVGAAARPVPFPLNNRTVWFDWEGTGSATPAVVWHSSAGEEVRVAFSDVGIVGDGGMAAASSHFYFITDGISQVFFASSFLLSDTPIYEPQVRALPRTAAHFC